MRKAPWLSLALVGAMVPAWCTEPASAEDDSGLFKQVEIGPVSKKFQDNGHMVTIGLNFHF